nr:hypothetical protein [Tanacetum cinerariifolium]
MDTTIDQQVARDEALVPHAKRLRIGRRNFRLLSNIKSKESTVQNKMHKAFPLLVRKFPLLEGTSYCLKKNATARRKVMPLPKDCTAVIVKKKLSVKDDSFLKISALCPALYSSSNRKFEQW